MIELTTATECYGIVITAPDEETRDAEIDRIGDEYGKDVEDIKMPCGFVVSTWMVPKEWETKMCPCGDPSHTLWKVEQRTVWTCPRCDSIEH